MGLRLANEVVKRLREISTTLSQLLSLQQSPRKNYLMTGALPGAGTVGVTGASCTVQPPLGNPPGVIISANPHRRGLNVQNLSATGGPSLTIGIGITQPTAGAGLVLPPGASWDGRISGELQLEAISVVASGASCSFCYLQKSGPSSRTPPNEVV